MNGLGNLRSPILQFLRLSVYHTYHTQPHELYRSPLAARKTTISTPRRTPDYLRDSASPNFHRRMPPKARQPDDVSAPCSGSPLESSSSTQVGLAARDGASQAGRASRSTREGVVPESPPHAAPVEPLETFAAQMLARFDLFGNQLSDLGSRLARLEDADGGARLPVGGAPGVTHARSSASCGELIASQLPPPVGVEALPVGGLTGAVSTPSAPVCVRPPLLEPVVPGACGATTALAQAGQAPPDPAPPIGGAPGAASVAYAPSYHSDVEPDNLYVPDVGVDNPHATAVYAGGDVYERPQLYNLAHDSTYVRLNAKPSGTLVEAYSTLEPVLRYLFNIDVYLGRILASNTTEAPLDVAEHVQRVRNSVQGVYELISRYVSYIHLRAQHDKPDAEHRALLEHVKRQLYHRQSLPASLDPLVRSAVTAFHKQVDSQRAFQLAKSAASATAGPSGSDGDASTAKNKRAVGPAKARPRVLPASTPSTGAKGGTPAA